MLKIHKFEENNTKIANKTLLPSNGSFLYYCYKKYFKNIRVPMALKSTTLPKCATNSALKYPYLTKEIS